MSVLNALGSVFSGILGYQSQREANKMQAKENQLNREFTRQMWNLENQYNTPQAQVNRLVTAGLNPNLAITGNLQNTAGSAGTPSTSNSFRSPGSAINDALSSYVGLKQADIAKQQSDSNIKVNESVINKNEAEAEKARQEAKRKSIENTYADANEIVDLMNKGKDFEAKNLANNFAKEANPEQIKILRQTLANAEKDGLIKEEQKNLLLAEIATEEERKELVKEQKNTEKSVQSKNYQEISESKSREILNKAMAGTQKFERQALAAAAKKSLSDAKRNGFLNELTDAEIDEINNKIEEAALQGSFDRLMEYNYRKFGTSTAGIISNAIVTGVESKLQTIKNIYDKITQKAYHRAFFGKDRNYNRNMVRKPNYNKQNSRKKK